MTEPPRLDGLPENGTVELRIEADVTAPCTAAPAVGLVLIGLPLRVIENLEYPAVLPIDGTVDVVGAVTRPLDAEALTATLPRFIANSEIAGLVVTGMNAGMNPAVEIEAAALCEQVGQLPVLRGCHGPRQSSAPERATSAAAALGWALLAAECVERVVARSDQMGAPRSVLITGGDTPLAAAFDALGRCPRYARLGFVHSVGELEATIRITRPERGCYACHCHDGRHDFDSLQAARDFGSLWLRELLTSKAAAAGMDRVTVDVEAEDRFARGQGRKGPMRVYLETILVGRLRMNDPA